MNNWDARDEPLAGQCTLSTDSQSALRAATMLGIPLHRLNLSREYWLKVFEPALRAYQGGRETPNPDVECNREIKFGAVWTWAQRKGFDALATGHYAQVYSNELGSWLMQAEDEGKDQSYFLSRMPPSSLPHVIFPLGHLRKTEVRKHASSLHMSWLLARSESMGICFVGNSRKRSQGFASVLRAYLPDNKVGPMVMAGTGRVVGEHGGMAGVTVGQGARIPSMHAKLYVARKDVQNNVLYLADSLLDPILNPSTLQIRNLTLRLAHPSAALRCSIRSQDKLGTPVLQVNASEIRLDGTVFAPAAGQYAVLYQDVPDAPKPVLVGSAVIA